jgi:two-component system, NtrC family, response regulator AtoC
MGNVRPSESGQHAVQELTGTVLIVDADTAGVEGLKSCLLELGFVAEQVATGREAILALESRNFDLLIADHRLSDLPAPALLAAVNEHSAETPVVFASADASAADAMDALRRGAADFVQKPFQNEEIALAVRKVQESSARRVDQPPPPSVPSGLVFGSSPAMAEAIALLDRAAPGTATVLIRGESGTGKELVARAIHERSPRANQPFVKIDCASLPETLLESELFGHEKGAFTGAVTRKPGRVELADGGTLLLDEIGELTPPLQAKLLRLLQDREFERLGSVKTIRVDVRVLAATHRNLEAMIERGEFRQDLFYRLNVVPLWLPPLRARRNDIELLARHFTRLFARANGKQNVELSPDALRVLRSQRWPGNVRQLQNFVERLVVLSAGESIEEEDVRRELGREGRFATEPGTVASAAARSVKRGDSSPRECSAVGPLEADMQVAERSALERALKHAGGNRSLAARLLGVSRSKLYAKLEEHGLL